MRLKKHEWLLFSTLALVSAASPLTAGEGPQPLEASRDFHLTDPQLAAFVEELLGENPEIRAATEFSLARRERVQQERSLPDPQLAYRVFLDTPETRVGPQKQGLEISQGLPWFGKRELQAKRAGHTATGVSWRAQDLERALVGFSVDKLHLQRSQIREMVAHRVEASK